MPLYLVNKVMEWQSWPNLLLEERKHLPDASGIYVIADNEHTVWYVGKSINIRTRWQGKGHHRYKQLSRTNRKRQYRVYWSLCPLEHLDQQEKHHINTLRPHLNDSPVKSYVRKPKTPGQEISRILRVINKKTALFPDIRSIVLGYYPEIEENEEGTLERFDCLVILTNVNDYDDVIAKSMKKSLSKKGRYLQDCWKSYQPQCGPGKDAGTAQILVFLHDVWVYEFVCWSQLIDVLGSKQSNLGYFELEQETVLALRDPKQVELDALPQPKGLPSRHDEYLRDRFPDLQPLSDRPC